MASLNICRGLFAKEAEIRSILSEEGLDVMFLQETDIKDFVDTTFCVQGYKTFTHPGEKKRSITLVKEDCFKQIEIRHDLTSTRPEVWVETELEGGSRLLLGNVYREHRPTDGLNAASQCEELTSMLVRLAEERRRVICAGDFNLDFSKAQERPVARDMKNRICSAGYELDGYGETFSRSVQGNLWSSSLDWVMSCRALTTQLWKKETGMSDHHMIGWSVMEGTAEPACKSRLVRSLKNVMEKKDTILNDLLHHPWENLVAMDVEEQGRKLIEWTMDSLNRICPLRPARKQKYFAMKPSKQLRRIRRERDNARGKKDVKNYKSLRNKAVVQARKETREHNHKKIQENPQEVWKILRVLQGGQEARESNITTEEGEVTGKAAAEAFATFFPQKISNLREKMPESLTQSNTAARRARSLGLCKNGIDFSTVEENTVKKAIQSMKPSKAADVHGISPVILKIIAPVIAVPLTLIINNSLLDATVPESWKKGKILPVHKKKSKKELGNYRPISILSTFSKVLEVVVKIQLSEQFEAKGIIPDTQHGFRPNCSTVTAIMAFEHDIRLALQKGRKAGALFLDLSAAFDLVDPKHLVPKLEKYGATARVCQWVKSFLTGRKQKVLYQEEESEEKENEVGAPQGSALSPFLFLILVSDMGEAVADLEGIHILSYADDTTVYATGKTQEEVMEKLEVAATKILQFMGDSGLAANPDKTHFLLFGGKGEAKIKIGTTMIPESSSEALVGFTVARSLTWQTHCQLLEKALLARIGILRRLSWHLPTRTLLQSLDPIFNSKLIYGLEVICDPITKGQGQGCKITEKLQVLQNDAMRAVLGLRRSDRIKQKELLQRCSQLSVQDLALRATLNQSWNVFSTEEKRKRTQVIERLKM